MRSVDAHFGRILNLQSLRINNHNLLISSSIDRSIKVGLGNAHSQQPTSRFRCGIWRTFSRNLLLSKTWMSLLKKFKSFLCNWFQEFPTISNAQNFFDASVVWGQHFFVFVALLFFATYTETNNERNKEQKSLSKCFRSNCM